MDFVAEISSNHLGDFDRAMMLIELASMAGATHVKFQCYEPDQMAIPGHIISSGPWEGHDMRELYRRGHTPKEWFPDLFESARKFGLVPFASPFHPDDVAFLESIDCPIYKVASCELEYTDLLEAIADTRKPVVISTGMATVYTLCKSVDFLASHYQNSGDITILKCTAAYPAKPEDANLAVIEELRKSFPGARVGISDHTLSNDVALAATAMGIDMIEKHLAWSRHDGGADAAFSLDADDFAYMVKKCKEVLDIRGSGLMELVEAETSTNALKRSLYIARDLPAGHVIQAEDLVAMRPGLGVSPMDIDYILDQATPKPLAAFTPISYPSFFRKHL